MKYAIMSSRVVVLCARQMKVYADTGNNKQDLKKARSSNTNGRLGFRVSMLFALIEQSTVPCVSSGGLVPQHRRSPTSRTDGKERGAGTQEAGSGGCRDALRLLHRTVVGPVWWGLGLLIPCSPLPKWCWGNAVIPIHCFSWMSRRQISHKII